MRKLQRDNDFNWYDFVQPGDRGLCKSFSNLKQFSIYFLNINIKGMKNISLATFSIMFSDCERDFNNM